MNVTNQSTQTEHIELRLFQAFRDKIDEILREISLTCTDYETGYKDASIAWNDYLNKLDVTIRPEFHLERPPQRNHIRITDPFFYFNRNLDIPRHIVDKVLFLGLP